MRKEIAPPELASTNKDKYLFGTGYTINFHEGRLICHDLYEMKFYELDFDKFKDYFKMLSIIKDDLFIKEGFVDRSLNTAIFSPLDNFTIVVGGVQFEAKEINKVNDFLQWL